MLAQVSRARPWGCRTTPGHGGCITPHSSSAPQPLCKPTTSRLDVRWVLSSVEVLRDRATEAEAAHGHRVGAGGSTPGHGGASPATRAQRHSPCASPPPRGWMLGGRCPVSRCSATGRPMPRRHTGTVSARVGRATGHGGCSSRHSSSAPQPLCKPTTSRLEVWFVQCRGAPRQGDLGRGCTRAIFTARRVPQPPPPPRPHPPAPLSLERTPGARARRPPQLHTTL